MKFTKKAVSDYINAAKDVDDVHRRKKELIQKLVDHPFIAGNIVLFAAIVDYINKEFKAKRLKFNKE